MNTQYTFSKPSSHFSHVLTIHFQQFLFSPSCLYFFLVLILARLAYKRFKRLPAETPLLSLLVRPKRPLPNLFSTSHKIPFPTFMTFYESGKIKLAEETSLEDMDRFVDFRMGLRDMLEWMWW